MPTTSRNAPCPCGSGKKYKLCCLSADGGTPPTSAAQVAANAVSAKALHRLTAFVTQPKFDPDGERAVEAFWSPVFLRRHEEERAAAYERDRTEGGELMYFTVDAPTAHGKTLVEQFLSEPRKGLLPAEQDFLRRLSATRMGIFRVESVQRNRGLTCTNLWSGERIDIREVPLTDEVGPGDVIGARPILAADGVWELDGAIYPFTPEQGDAVLANLRAMYALEREADPTLTEERFLKQRAAALINRFWFDHVFFPVDEDDLVSDFDDEDDSVADIDDDDDDDDIEAFTYAEDDQPRNALDAFTPRERRPPAASAEANSGEARAGFLTDVVSSDPEILKLRDFLDSDAAPDAMPIDWLHGFLCAIACGPTKIDPLVWLPHVWGDTPPDFASPAQADQITRAIIDLANSIEQAVRAKTFEPLLPRRVKGDMTNVAQGWCAGFEEAIRLDADAWAPLLEAEDQRVLLAPLVLIGMSSDELEDDDDPENHAQMVADSIDILPSMVGVIDDYWHRPQRTPLRAKRVLARRRPSKAMTPR